MTKSSKRTRVVLGLAGVGLAVYLLYDIFRNTDIPSAIRTVSTLTVAGALLILAPSLLGAGLDAYGWKLLLPIRSKRHAFWPVLRIRVASEAIVNSVPFGAVVSDPFKTWLIRKQFGISLACGSASVALRTFVLAESQSLIVLLSSIAGFVLLSAFSQQIFHNGWLNWICILVSLGALALYSGLITASTSGSMVQRLHARLMRVKWAKLHTWFANQEIHFRELNTELQSFGNERRQTLWTVLLLFIGLWSMEGVETFIILKLIGTPISFGRAYLLEAICSFIRSIAVFVPAGLGAQDAGYVAFLTSSGESQAVAVAFILIKRIRQVLWIVVGMALLFLSRKKAAASGSLAAPETKI